MMVTKVEYEVEIEGNTALYDVATLLEEMSGLGEHDAPKITPDGTMTVKGRFEADDDWDAAVTWSSLVTLVEAGGDAGIALLGRSHQS